MPDPRVQIRRGRRTDFTVVMHLLATSGVAVPPPDRATLRRFRHIIADLGNDLYLASIEGTMAGLVHVTYARQLTGAPHARLDELVVADPFRRRGVGTALLRFARERAQRHGCGTVSCVLPPPARPGSAARGFLINAGLQPAGEWFVQPLEVTQ